MSNNSITVGSVDSADKVEIQAFSISLAETRPVVTVDMKRLSAVRERRTKIAAQKTNST